MEVSKKTMTKALALPGDVIINLVEDEDGDWGMLDRLSRKLIGLGRSVVALEKETLGYWMDKAKMKKILELAGVRTPKFRVVREERKLGRVLGMEFPLIVKPAGEHASLGITQDSVVIDQKELVDRVEFLRKQFGGEVLIEEYVEGREVHVSVMGKGKHIAIFPYAEIDFVGEYADNWNVYSYDAKWDEKSWEYWSSPVVCPAILGRKLEKEVDAVVKKAHRALDCCDIVRFDLRISEKGLASVIDVNVLPSLKKGDEEECWRSVKAVGWTYEQMIETIVAIAYKRSYGRLPDRLRERRLLLDYRVS